MSSILFILLCCASVPFRELAMLFLSLFLLFFICFIISPSRVLAAGLVALVLLLPSTVFLMWLLFHPPLFVYDEMCIRDRSRCTPRSLP